MSENKETVYLDDFEVIMDSNESSLLSETQFPPGQNETGNMEELNNSMDTSAEFVEPVRQQPVPRPRNRSQKDEHHFKREATWTKEKEELLCKKHELEEKVRELERRNEEILKETENKKEMLQNKYEELLRKNSEMQVEKDEAFKTIKELQAKGLESQKCVQDLESKVENLQKCLDEQTESHNASMQTMTGFEGKEREYENEIQRLKEDVANSNQQNHLGNGRIVELQAITVQLQSDLAKERESLSKQKEDVGKKEELYQELASINDDMEKEQHEHKTKIRELAAELQKKDTENEKLLQEKNEVVHQLQKSSADFRKQRDKLNNNAHEIQSQKDQLENELIAVRLQQKHMDNANASHAGEVQEMQNKAVSLREERDFYFEKCKELEKGMKLNADNEIKQLSKALEALNEENEILRKRNVKYEKDIGLLNNKRSELESKLSQLSQKQGKLDDGSTTVPAWNPAPYRSYTESPDAEPTTQKQAGIEPMDTTTNSQQWYQSEEGEKLLSEVYQKLQNKFGAGPVEMSRARSTQDLSLTLTTEHRQKFEVFFPRNFPHVAFKVKLGGKSAKEIMVPFNRNASSNFAAQVAQHVYEAVSTRKQSKPTRPTY